MERSGINIVTLIEAVESHPCLWDQTVESYKNKIEKQNAWQLVCETVVQNFQELEEGRKILVDKAVKSKWNNVRDYFIKLIKTTKGKGFKRKYIYHDQLLFLLKTIQLDTTTDSSFHEEEVEIKTEFLNLDIPSSSQHSSSDNDQTDIHQDRQERKRRKVFDPIEQEIKANLHTKSDDDASFLESILPATKKIPEEKKLQFRIEVMQLIQRFTSSTSSSRTNSKTYRLSYKNSREYSSSPSP